LLCSSRIVEMVRSAGDRSCASEVAHWSCPALSRIASASSALERYRQAVADDKSGTELERLVAAVRK